MRTRLPLRSNAQPVIAAVSMLLCVAGCNVGRELVDRGIAHGKGGSTCMAAPACDTSIPDIELGDDLAHGAALVSFNDCDAGPPRCPLDPVDAAAQRDGLNAGVDAAADGGVEPSPGACNPDQPPRVLDDAELDCKNVRVQFDANSNTEIVHGARLSNMNLAFASTTPRTLTLQAGSLVHVFVRLEGAVMLRLTNSVLLDDVGIAGHANEHGTPRLAIEDTPKATRLSVGEADRPFAGTLSVTRSRVFGANLDAASIELSSVHVEASAIRAPSVLAADASLLAVTLELGAGTFSAAYLRDVDVLSCNALALLSSTIEHSQLAPCSNEPLRAYSTNVSDCVVDGAVDSDKSQWSGVRFGVHSHTEILAWGTSIDSSMFCRHGDALRFGADANRVHCADCLAEALTVPLCVIPGGRVGNLVNLCPALTSAEDEPAPTCSGTFPPRPRPQ